MIIRISRRELYKKKGEDLINDTTPDITLSDSQWDLINRQLVDIAASSSTSTAAITGTTTGSTPTTTTTTTTTTTPPTTPTTTPPTTPTPDTSTTHKEGINTLPSFFIKRKGDNKNEMYCTY